MEGPPLRQPNEDSQPAFPAALYRWSTVLNTMTQILWDFDNRKRLTDGILQRYIGQLNGIAMEVAAYMGCFPRSERKRQEPLLRHMQAAMRKLDEAREALLRGNAHLRHVDQALRELLAARSECQNL